MAKRYKGDLCAKTDGDTHATLARSGFFADTNSKAELRKRLETASDKLPVGLRVRIDTVYALDRGPGAWAKAMKRQHEYGATLHREVLELVDRGAWYDPTTGKARPPRWKRRVDCGTNPGTAGMRRRR